MSVTLEAWSVMCVPSHTKRMCLDLPTISLRKEYTEHSHSLPTRNRILRLRAFPSIGHRHTDHRSGPPRAALQAVMGACGSSAKAAKPADVNVAIAVGAEGLSKAIATASQATADVSKTAGASTRFVMDTVVNSVGESVCFMKSALQNPTNKNISLLETTASAARKMAQKEAGFYRTMAESNFVHSPDCVLSMSVDGTKRVHPALGVIRLDYNYPAAVGDIAHSGSFTYGVFYRVIPGLTFEMTQSGKMTSEVQRAFIAGVKYLVQEKKVCAITGDCALAAHNM